MPDLSAAVKELRGLLEKCPSLPSESRVEPVAFALGKTEWVSEIRIGEAWRTIDYMRQRTGSVARTGPMVESLVIDDTSEPDPGPSPLTQLIVETFRHLPSLLAAAEERDGLREALTVYVDQHDDGPVGAFFIDDDGFIRCDCGPCRKARAALRAADTTKGDGNE